MNSKLPIKLAVAGMISLALFSGCGRSEESVRAAASGLVNYDGRPLKNGTIRFIPATPGEPEKSTEIVGGRFQLSAEMGPVVGANRVEIDANGPGAFDDEELMAELEASGANKGPVCRKKFDVPTIPAKYNRQTELTATVVEGKQNTFEFDLRSR